MDEAGKWIDGNKSRSRNRTFFFFFFLGPREGEDGDVLRISLFVSLSAYVLIVSSPFFRVGFFICILGQRRRGEGRTKTPIMLRLFIFPHDFFVFLFFRFPFFLSLRNSRSYFLILLILLFFLVIVIFFFLFQSRYSVLLSPSLYSYSSPSFLFLITTITKATSTH